jgi:hypothetical protein
MCVCGTGADEDCRKKDNCFYHAPESGGRDEHAVGCGFLAAGCVKTVFALGVACSFFRVLSSSVELVYEAIRHQSSMVKFFVYSGAGLASMRMTKFLTRLNFATVSRMESQIPSRPDSTKAGCP